MKKVTLVITLALVALLFASCKKENKLEQQIIGKWMIADMNGNLELTNKKQVFTFISPTKASVSTSMAAKPGMPSLWMDHLETEMVISDSKFTLTSHPDSTTTIMDENDVTFISDMQFISNRKLTMYKDGEVSFTTDMTIRFVKVTVDFSEAILGLWEGRSTGEHSEFDDGENHRWEYFADGNFHYYHKVDGEWQLSDDEFSQYFVDGTLLCTRWKNDGMGQEEHREWWEIASIEDNVMNWTALRQNEDGTTYTTTFSMIKME